MSRSAARLVAATGSAPTSGTRRRRNRALLAWHATSGRMLVVREAATPWAILVAEVMSQQTQIERIGPAWRRWMARWPSPVDLAAAPARDVVTAWAGLGYNRRALALHETARAIVRDHAGQVPATLDELEALPGIGRYTARAVAAAAFGRPVAPLDVNVRRVVARWLGWQSRGAGSVAGEQAAADELVSRRHARRWVDAAMDLAATICTRRAPACGACPVRSMCASAGTPGEAARAAAPSVRFESTNRWLRGRLLASVREASGAGWVTVPERLGVHGRDAIRAALQALEAEGFLDLRGDRARLREA